MNIYDIPVTTIDGQATTLAEYRGKVLLVVNVASKCAFTRQYAGLEDLYRRTRDRGLVVLGFPCDQFGHQEPGGEAEIRQFCSLNYDVSFPLFAKVTVNGSDAHPLFRHLKAQQKGLFGTEAIKWNFTKFLVDRAGNVVKRYGPAASPARVERGLAALLDASQPAAPA